MIALECIFHFPSRRRFLREVHRILRPSGRLVITDLVPRARSIPSLGKVNSQLTVHGDTGIPTPVIGYKVLARLTSMPICDNIDISEQTMPTFGPYGELVQRFAPDGREEMELMARIVERGQMSYRLITFEKR